ncbi:unnamed protein product [Trifolium pratense]|uniref:Uncharacterized protein n=1 Tax=Trifolium pratense TaxID=57577 RepID=A0ACB0J126_TRIPR|nr:unnamed protein product [Trifolium pratense]
MALYGVVQVGSEIGRLRLVGPRIGYRVSFFKKRIPRGSIFFSNNPISLNWNDTHRIQTFGKIMVQYQLVGFPVTQKT